MIAMIDNGHTSTVEPRPVEMLMKTVSASRLNCWLQCRLKFFFRYVLKITKPKTPALHYGSVLNTRKRVLGHNLVALGSLDTCPVSPLFVFRPVFALAGSAIILAHNHPSGDPTPSEADIKVTRDLIRAGQLLKIDVVDHVIIGQSTHSSLRALGYFC